MTSDRTEPEVAAEGAHHGGLREDQLKAEIQALQARLSKAEGERDAERKVSALAEKHATENAAAYLALQSEAAALRVERDGLKADYLNAHNAKVDFLERAIASEAREAAFRETFAKPIGMQDVRLVAGEGKLGDATVLQAVNVIIAQRAKDNPNG